MIINVDGLQVIFPYPHIYAEQYQYMQELKRGIDAKGHLILEMPSGTGKTISLLSLLVAYKEAHPNVFAKIVYCTRTVPEMEKCLEELRRLMQFREEVLGRQSRLVGLGLSARKNLCVHPTVKGKESGAEVDSACKSLTASWVARPSGAEEPLVYGCDFYTGLERAGAAAEALPAGIYTLRELRLLGIQKGWCPYFLARRAIEAADIVVYNYAYLLDPKIANVVSDKLPGNSVIVFDEGHNIDNVCIEVLSLNLSEETITGADSNLRAVQQLVVKAKQANKARLEEEYKKLLDGLALAGVPEADRLQGLPITADLVDQEALPGNMRRGEHFLGLLNRILDWLRTRVFTLKSPQVATAAQFLGRMLEDTVSDAQEIKRCTERLQVLLNTLQVADLYNYRHLMLIADCATLLATYGSGNGFQVVFEPYDDRNPAIAEPILQIACMDASLAVRPIFTKFEVVVLTSGTLSPIEMYSKLLGFQPLTAKSLEITLLRPCICPLIVTRGADQVAVNSRYEVRSEPAVMRNYGQLLLELAQVVPDGLIAFFTSYQYMEEIVSQWHDAGILTQLTKHKLVFIETQDVAETALALKNYRAACDIGRGAIFMSISRGKVAEGIDFDGHYGRCVVMLGIPYVYVMSRVLKERLKWMDTNLKIKEDEFLTFDALRHASQCIGRVMRHKSDYGMMILADKRYNRVDKRAKLPLWIQQCIRPSFLNLSTDVAVHIARTFLKEMAQPWQKEDQYGKTLLREEDIARLQESARAV
eukprot:TRINITY_DN30295_c0_g1_i1.p1 TRINITY_DN30295_c0_g1~~TRINITY_DN30295_c0_g1_i1.p1  ORF type:complete len:759 (+),score=178.92 TRINITY_DN30295_c0_g1_i1:41-2317(+)